MRGQFRAHQLLDLSSIENLTKVLFFQYVSVFYCTRLSICYCERKKILYDFIEWQEIKKERNEWKYVCDINDFVGFVCARHFEATTFECSLK